MDKPKTRLRPLKRLEKAGVGANALVSIDVDGRDVPAINAVHQSQPHLFRRLDETPHHNP